ncbi:MAG TPA: zf-TFIIB domain-containing protein [Anaeromyxobacteraceae bacterium]|nr:zf-TFIIB domain-containing protein [Anaeromyxobacteraceae bacterium]
MSETQKPSQTEDEYFMKEEAERKRKLALQVKRETSEAEAKRLRELHHNHCPSCGQKMQELALRGVPVDVCFACQGIFLSHGELKQFQDQIAAGKRGVVAAILNWFKPEVEGRGK